MRRIRVYVDTSVFGGTQDAEFAWASRRFLHRVQEGHFTIVVSSMVIRELADAPTAVQDVLRELDAVRYERVELSGDVKLLANAYLEAGIVPPGSSEDAIHVAAATVAGVDLIVSWNFRHIVCYRRIHMYNGINLLKGYRMTDIRSPRELSYAYQND
jgi:predicted nucleic acid-binding protein